MSESPAIAVRGLTKRFGGRIVVDHVDLTVMPGRICGFLGPNGSGKTTTLRMICGLLIPDAGEGEVLGLDLANQRRAIKHKIGYMTQKFGLFSDLSIAENLILKRYRRPPISRAPFLRPSVIAAEASDLMQQFDVRAPSAETPTRRLSGGNVQKVLLAREMSGAPKVLVVSSPTQGLDVGAVATVHRLLLNAAADGVGVLLVSEDLDEVMALSDRIAVMYEGKILETFDASEADVSRIGLLMGGAESDRGAVA